jgi:hypothetical protein
MSADWLEHFLCGFIKKEHWLRFGRIATECNGMAIREFGLVTVNGSLFARKVRESPLHKDADVSIEGEWSVEF